MPICVVGGKSCALSLREIGKDRLTPARRQKERKKGFDRQKWNKCYDEFWAFGYSGKYGEV